jgi:SRSO17 transposase
VKGLLSNVESRNGWTLAEAAGHRTPDRMRKLLRRAVWDEAGVREDVRRYVTANLGDPRGVLVFDETGDIEQGSGTVGVAGQYTGVTGQVGNRRVAVFAAYVSPKGHALVDAELHLPGAFALDEARCERAGVPAQRRGAVVPEGDPAALVPERAPGAGMPFAYAAGDGVYGRSSRLRAPIEAAGGGYVPEAPYDEHVSLPARTLRAHAARDLVAARSRELRSRGPGAKGLRYHAWAWMAPDSGECPEGWRRSLLIRRDRQAGSEYAYFPCHHRRALTPNELAEVAGRRWAVEGSLAICKSDAGLDQHRVRRRYSRYRHTVPAVLAAAFPAVMRARPPTNPSARQTG